MDERESLLKAAPRKPIWVYLEESCDRREVKKPCRGACRLAERDLLAQPFQLVVSPSGVAHLTNEYGDTDCGKDATRDGWWWPM